MTGESYGRVAVISDIHANLPALEAAVDAIDGKDAQVVYCGGDLVGYGPHPNEVCRLIEERRIPTIHGNYDYAVARDLEDCGCVYGSTHDRELGRRSIAWTLERTDRRSKDFLRGLPFDLRFILGTTRVRLVHGSPRRVDEYLFEDTPARTFERVAADADCEVLVFGHTHKPWVHEYGGVLFVTAVRSESQRTATRAVLSRCSSSTSKAGYPSRSSVSSTTLRRSRVR